MNHLLALLFSAASLGAFGYASDKEDTRVFDFAIEPKKIHEECVRMEAGQRRAYHWKSSAPVDFNIHYHRGAEVFYPVKRDGMRGDGGNFIAATADDYCWMWTARNAPAKVEGRIDTSRK